MRAKRGSPPPRKAVVAAVCALIVAMSGAPPGHAWCDFLAIFNFGDSNSNTGGFWATFFGRPSGRASDGRLVIDFLTQALGIPFLSPYLQSIGSNYTDGANFATLVSTVMLSNTSQFVTGISPFSLAIQLSQMKQFKVRVLELAYKEDIFGRSLYTLDIDQNDFTSNLAAVGSDGFKQYLPQVVDQIAWTIRDLPGVEPGARRVLPCVPLEPGIFDLDEHGCVVSYNDAVEQYNILLKEALRRTQSSLAGATVVYADTHAVKLELFRHPADHGTAVTATACADPQNYVSWDGIHATEAANKLVATAILGGSYLDPPFRLADHCDLQPIG
ncbi:unnamed protein product [Spirodela intermedia]|uniref:Uncharacterized protein n=1 Tax=Spirodela intermedia TaxID=51605 RepID=A0A7I8J8Y1_SPIIN|nr:unnamed protein product [Spirodela intermedia]CAA6665912.1 unnamed protein product [Spirodela intermedia]